MLNLARGSVGIDFDIYVFFVTNIALLSEKCITFDIKC